MSFALLVSLLLGDVASDLALARRQLASFDFDGAVTTLEHCREQPGRTLEEGIALYELLGVALASDGRTVEAEAAFVTLATIAPAHAISYTLSPKVTFVFERARERALRQGVPGLQLLWPLSADVNVPVRVDVEVLADPGHALARGRLTAERDGEPPRTFLLDLPAVGTRGSVVVPPPDHAAEAAGVLKLYLAALDAHGNEIARVGSPDQPRTVALTYEPPKRWYQRPLFWVVSSIVVSGAIAGTIYAVTHDTPKVIPVDVAVP